MIAVLSVLADRAPEPCHGYDLCRLLGLKAGTVYPLLRRLAERDLVATRWEIDPPTGRPPRHLYRLTPAGEELVANFAAPSAVVAPDPSPPNTRPVLSRTS
jgi:PadR family transcriptional regulator, regulatory protein PadR